MVEKMRKRSGEWRPSAPNPRNDRAPNNRGFAHAVESVVEAAFRRGDLFGKRQMLMDHWSRFVCGIQEVQDSGTATN